jgi:gluconolactonase
MTSFFQKPKALLWIALWMTGGGCAHGPDTRDLTLEQVFTASIEGPAFNREGELFVVNYREQGTVGRIAPDGKGEVYLKLPSGGIGNSIQFNSRGEMWVADYGSHRVWSVESKTRKLRSLVHEPRMNQPNDMAIARDDTLFLSDPDWNRSTGQLWRVDPKGKVVLLEKDMGTTNGIALSPDQRTLYVTVQDRGAVEVFRQ